MNEEYGVQLLSPPAFTQKTKQNITTTTVKKNYIFTK